MVRYIVELATALARRSDVELHVLVSREAAGFFGTLLPAHRVHVLMPMPRALRSLAERFGVAIPRPLGGFDVVHGAKHLIPRRLGAAVRLLTVHDMLPLDRPWDFGLLKRILLRIPYLGSVDDADVITCVSSATLARLLDYVPTARGRAVVVPLGASMTLRDMTPAPVPGLEGRRFALVVGDASARKNLALAVETWPQILVAVPDAVLAVVGPVAWAGEHRGARWSELVASGSIRHLGHLGDDELAWCYRNAAVVLCPSLLEGFGLPTVEAATFGARVVTSEDAAMCEASGPRAQHVATWQQDEWVIAVGAALRDGAESASPSPEPLRTWDDVASDTLDAVRNAGIPAPEAGRTSLQARIGVSPYRAPLRVRHILGPNAPWSRHTVDDLAARHRAQGWSVEVLDAMDPSTAAGNLDATGTDVVVLHGLAAGDLRRDLRGVVTTVVIAGREGPKGVLGWIGQMRLARWTNAVVVDADAARRWARFIPVPITSLPVSPDGDLELADEEFVAALLVRARAWGASRTTARSDQVVARRLPTR